MPRRSTACSGSSCRQASTSRSRSKPVEVRVHVALIAPDGDERDMNAFREAGSMRAQPVGSHFVDGTFVDGDGPEFESIHPGDRSVIARLRAADTAVIEQAMDAARTGF